LNAITSAGFTSVVIGASSELELVDKFCYLGNLPSVILLGVTPWVPPHAYVNKKWGNPA